LAVGVLAAGWILVRAQSVADDFSTTDYVGETWQTTVDTGQGKVTLAERSCDDADWFCNVNDVCANELGDGDYIVVAREDATTTQLEWKPSNTACDRPQCGQDGGQDGDNLVADNTVVFDGYPARDACKAQGGRLPTKTELQCIYSNRSVFGDNFAADNYWSATERDTDYAWRVGFTDGGTNGRTKGIDYYVRCVTGW